MWPRRPAKARKHGFADAASQTHRHLDAHVIPGDGVTTDRGSSQLRQHKAADSVHVRMFERDANRIAGILEPDGTPHDDSSRRVA